MLNVDSSVSLNAELLNTVVKAPSSNLPSDIKDDLLRTGVIVAQRRKATDEVEWIPTWALRP